MKQYLVIYRHEDEVYIHVIDKGELEDILKEKLNILNKIPDDDIFQSFPSNSIL